MSTFLRKIGEQICAGKTVKGYHSLKLIIKDRQRLPNPKQGQGLGK